MSQHAGDLELARRLNRTPFSTSTSSASSSQPSARTPFGEKSITPVIPTRQPVTPFWTSADNASPSMGQAGTSGRGVVADHEQENGTHARIKHRRTLDSDEIEQARKKLKDAQFELSTTRTELELKIITLEQAVRTSEIEREKLATRADELQSQRRFLFEKEKKTSAKNHELEEQLNEYKKTSDETIRTLDDEIYNIKETLAGLTERHRHTESQLSQRVQELQDSLSYQEETLTQFRDTSESQSNLAEDKHRQLSEALERVANLELENRQLKQREQEFEHVDWTRKELQNQVSYGQQLETKNRQLIAECNHYKDMYRNAEVLKEEKAALQQKLTMLDDLRIKYGMLEVQIGVMRKEKQQWLAFLDEADSRDFNSPHDLAKTIASLRREQSALVGTNGELEASVRSRDSFITQLETQLKNLKCVLMEQEQQMTKLSAKARRCEQSKDLAHRQVDSLKEQLKSYDMEETNLMGGSFDNSKNARIAELEKLVQEYYTKLEAAIATSAKQANSSLPETAVSVKLLQSMTDDHSATFNQLSQEKQELFETKNLLEVENARLRTECASLEAKVEEHELAIGAGAFNPVTSRVLEIKDSPAARHQAVRQHMLDSLKEENTELLKVVAQQQRRLDNLAEGELSSMGTDQDADLSASRLVPAASFNRLKGDFQRLQEEINNAKKRSDRMEEIWGTKSDEYLEAVEALLGYRFNFLEDGRVEVVSVYDSAEHRSFVFSSGENDEGTMELVGTGSNRYVDSHREEAMRLIREVGSIPAFLSQATLDAVEELEQRRQEHGSHMHQLQADHLHRINQRQSFDADSQNVNQVEVVLPRALGLGRRGPMHQPPSKNQEPFTMASSEDDQTNPSDMTMDMTMG
ncbi:coiled-coil domain-containing protein mad1 [Podila verticillata]|nr:coiled-coil domain-containing protein mad1 [Podila verticillata]